MSTTTFMNGPAVVTDRAQTTRTATTQATARTTAQTTAEGSFLGRMMAKLIAGRQEQARRAVVSHLAQMSDARLAELGFSTQQIAELRLQGRFPASFWD